MLIFIFIICLSNVKTNQVRAEAFGQESLLYELISTDQSTKVEVVKAQPNQATQSTSSSYLAYRPIDERWHVDLDNDNFEFENNFNETPKSIVNTREKTENYIIQEGDTLSKIAKQFGLQVSTVLWSNNLTLRSTIQPGDSLKILPKDGVIYSVKNGDTLSKIATSFDAKTEDILKSNEHIKISSLQIGDEIFIPNGKPPVVQTKKSVSVKDVFVKSPTSGSKKKTADGSWVWPTDWKVITQYFGWRHTGLDIDGTYQTSSYAAHDGVVSYSGWRNGYGMTVEIDHGDGMKTRYAHHSKLFVKTGETVFAGQKIAQTGSTGRSTGTHLHFEIILHGRFQNPLDYVR